MKDKKGLAKVLMYHVLKGKVLCQSENTDLGDNKLIPTMDAKSRIRVNLFFNDKVSGMNGGQSCRKKYEHLNPHTVCKRVMKG